MLPSCDDFSGGGGGGFPYQRNLRAIHIHVHMCLFEINKQYMYMYLNSIFLDQINVYTHVHLKFKILHLLYHLHKQNHRDVNYMTKYLWSSKEFGFTEPAVTTVLAE